MLKYLKIYQDKSPASSPDLNPIEWVSDISLNVKNLLYLVCFLLKSQVWNDMKHFIQSKFCQTQAQIREAVEEYYETLTAEKCSRFIDRLTGVMEEIILSGGEWVGK
jgi:hypothetical protein